MSVTDRQCHYPCYQNFPLRVGTTKNHQRNTSSTRVVNTRSWIFQISARRRIFWETSDDTCEGVYTTNHRNENTRQPSWPGFFEVSHWWGNKNTWYLGWGTWLSCKNDAVTHMVHGMYDLITHTSKTRSGTVPITVSVFSRCPHKCIFEHSEGHNGPVRNTNLSPVPSESMWSQPILIQLLAENMFEEYVS